MNALSLLPANYEEKFLDISVSRLCRSIISLSLSLSLALHLHINALETTN